MMGARSFVLALPLHLREDTLLGGRSWGVCLRGLVHDQAYI